MSLYTKRLMIRLYTTATAEASVGGEDAAEDAAQDDDGHQQRPDALAHGGADLPQVGLLMGRQIVLVAVIQAVGNQSHRQNDARQHGAQEQLRHGHIGDAGVHDQHNGGGMMGPRMEEMDATPTAKGAG